MQVDYQWALEGVKGAAALVFDRDRRTRSVGVGRVADGFGYIAIRNVNAAVPYSATCRRRDEPSCDEYQGVPIQYRDSFADPTSLARIPHRSPGAGSLHPEQQRQQPLVCGLEIQNYDDDDRQQVLASGCMTVGTLGCFVVLSNGAHALLSNSHVVAGETRGLVGKDRILHAACTVFDPTLHVGTLTDFAPLVASPSGATMLAGNVRLNTVDAGVASIAQGQAFRQCYLPGRRATPPSGAADANLFDRVHKVGSTTGLTFGVVTQVAVLVEAVGYQAGQCWFENSYVIEGVNGAPFSAPGDSGSAIVRDSDGMVVRLIYAGSGPWTYACPATEVLKRFNGRLA